MVFALVGFTNWFRCWCSAVWWPASSPILSLMSNRNSRAQERLERISRPASLAEIEDPKLKKDRFQGVMETAKALSGPLMPQTELEQSRVEDPAGQRRLPQRFGGGGLPGLRFAVLMGFLLLGAGHLPAQVRLHAGGPEADRLLRRHRLLSAEHHPVVYLRKKRQEEIFLALPDALDLLVVCVESGLGLDAAMRKVCDEMKDHAKVICRGIFAGQLPAADGPAAPRGAARSRCADGCR